MWRLYLSLIAIAFFCCKNKASNIAGVEEFNIHSTFTGDTYIIKIRKPIGYNTSDSFHLVYATDGTIGIGNYLLGKDSSWSAQPPDNCIIITIGHIGNWEMKRRRDFIPSDITGDSTAEFGKADKFYVFLKNELTPFIDQKKFNQKSKVFIGHSFGGLFCLYAALKNEKLFDGYFAISPSVWANYYELMKIEKDTYKKTEDITANVFVYAGSLEIFNKVLSSSEEFCDSINSRNYPHLKVNFHKINSANHFSIRKPVVDKILEELKND